MSSKVHPTPDHPHMKDGTFDLVVIRWNLFDSILFEDGRGNDLPCPDFAKEIVAKTEDPNFKVGDHIDEVIALVVANGYTHEEDDIAASRDGEIYAFGFYKQNWYAIDQIHLGEIEDFYNTRLTIGICRTEADGKAVCDKLIAENKMVSAAVDYFHEIHWNWIENNPCPQPPYPEQPTLKKWPAGIGEKQIISAMRQEREDAKKRIAEIREQYNKACEELEKPWVETLGSLKKQWVEKYFADHPEITPKAKVRINAWLDGGWNEYRCGYIPAEKLKYEIRPIDVMDPITKE